MNTCTCGHDQAVHNRFLINGVCHACGCPRFRMAGTWRQRLKAWVKSWTELPLPPLEQR